MSYCESGSDGGWGRELRPETILIDEIVSSNRGTARGAERALMSALLFDGIQAYLSYVASSKPQKSRFREACNWINSKEKEYIFSFNNVCECLGIDPDYLRCGLINASTTEAQNWSKVRRTS